MRRGPGLIGRARRAPVVRIRVEPVLEPRDLVELPKPYWMGLAHLPFVGSGLTWAAPAPIRDDRRLQVTVVRER